MKTNIEYETHRSYDKSKLTRVDIEELTDKEEERTNYLEEKDFVTEIEPSEVQVAHKESNQLEDTESVKTANRQPRKTRYFK